MVTENRFTCMHAYLHTNVVHTALCTLQLLSILGEVLPLPELARPVCPREIPSPLQGRAMMAR